MQLILNGEARSFEGQNIYQLLQDLGYVDKRIAVELNGEIVPKSQHAETILNDGDQLEIVVAVGGG